MTLESVKAVVKVMQRICWLPCSTYVGGSESPTAKGVPLTVWHN